MASKQQSGAAIKITRIEEKMGLHASPTCQMAFDDCSAELIGGEGAGLAFTLMNHARIDVALQGVALATRAYGIASVYASDRKQGWRADGSDAVLTDHADVRRMLDRQQVLAIGARGMAHVALVEMQLGTRPALVDFLMPLCKIFCTQAGVEAADLGLQTLGGYGYLTEYGIAQTWADARITMIYEGANGIHATALATRGLRQPGGADAFDDLIGELTTHKAVIALLGKWRKARATVHQADDPTILAHDFAQLSCTVFHRAICARIAELNPEWSEQRDFALSQPLPVSSALS